MPAYLEFTCDVDADGRLPKKWSEAVRANLRQRAGDSVTVVVCGERRSINANRYYRGPVLRPILASYAENGEPMTGPAFHEFAKAFFLPYVAERVRAEGGEAPQYVREHTLPDGRTMVELTTTKLDRTAFFYFVEAVKAWARSDRGVVFDDDGEDADYVPADLRRARSFDLEEGRAQLWDPHEVPDYSAEDVIPTMADL